MYDKLKISKFRSIPKKSNLTLHKIKLSNLRAFLPQKNLPSKMNGLTKNSPKNNNNNNQSIEVYSTEKKINHRLSTLKNHLKSGFVQIPFSPSFTNKFSSPICTSWQFSHNFVSANQNPLDLSHLRGKAAIVTGSTSGIGLGIAEHFAKQGANLTMNGFFPPDKPEIKTSFFEKISQLEKQNNIKIYFSSSDVSKENEAFELVQKTKEKFGSVDILVNNAGVQFVSEIESFPNDQFNRIIQINLNSCFYLTKAVIPLMKEKNWGRIINISSVHGLVGSIGKSAYVSSKHGVMGLTKVTALETAETNITCNTINPGWVLTPLVKAQINEISTKFQLDYEAAKNKLLKEKQPSGNFVEISDLAGVCLFLCTKSAAQMTGSALVVDGGWTSQ